MALPVGAMLFLLLVLHLRAQGPVVDLSFLWQRTPALEAVLAGVLSSIAVFLATR